VGTQAERTAERIPARIGRPLRLSAHGLAEGGFDRFMPHKILQLGRHDPSGPTLAKGPPQIVGRSILHPRGILGIDVYADPGGTRIGRREMHVRPENERNFRPMVRPRAQH